MNFLRGIGPLEIFLIFVIIMVVFGVGKLPEVGQGLGRGIRLFKDSLAGKEEKIDKETTKTSKSKK
ncbi:MAG: twin-arginine translocase TatA/TatE family subunit [Rickettsiales bacterium]|jgi:sec-independent protein translocase protein TatA|nr:twin-arginine translocase TatA/TatE family subunit [Chloroflexota bacterium]MBE31776.1 twin-arginine translocase TatA/TatE family subunit [Rickettsiales bacterium]|tara:strand:+ start:2771 stop:2968 length:198 start_codon:yes stop_codon:yes gene_type:complete